MSEKPLRRQISFYVPIEIWLVLRMRAASQGVPITRLILDVLEPYLAEWAVDDDTMMSQCDDG